MKVKIPKKVLNCKKHSICVCAKWKLEELETAIRIIRTWASMGSSYTSYKQIEEYCDEKLEAIKETAKNE